MKKSVLISLLLLLPFLYSAQIFKFVFTGAEVCPTPGNVPTVQDPNTIVSPLTRVGTNCNVALGAFNSNNWSTNTTIDENTYVEVTAFAMGGHQLNLSSFSFDTRRSSNGPTSGRVAMDSGTGSFTQFYDFTPTTSNQVINWDFPDISLSAGYTVRFRIYGWNATLTSGTMRFNNVQLQGSTTDQSHWNITGNAGTNSSVNFLGTIDNQDLVVKTSNTEKMRVTSAGKVTMGGATLTCSDCANYRLFVKDGVRTEKVKVDIASTNGWADYVFKDGYILKPLEEVEKFVSKNGHLPNIPSAAEMVRNGLDVAEMDAKLLEKIEELTLYSIDLNKKNKTLNDQIQQQQQAINRLLQKVEQLDKKSE